MFTWETDHLTKVIRSVVICGLVEFRLFFALLVHEERSSQLALACNYTHISVLLLHVRLFSGDVCRRSYVNVNLCV